MLLLVAWSIRYAISGLADLPRAVKRSGPLRDRLAVRAMRLGAVAWGLGERFGIDLVGSTEGPPVNADPERRKVFDELIAAAREGDGTVPVAECPYPAHELLTHLVLQRGLLLHGSNNASLEVLEARPAHDLGTVLEAVVTSDDAIWPMFYAVIDRERVKALFTGCVHVGRPPRLRRFYFFAVDGDPPTPAAGPTASCTPCPGPAFAASGDASG